MPEKIHDEVEHRRSHSETRTQPDMVHAEADSHAVKKRKPTYLVRKEEEKALRDEIEQLQTQVAELHTPADSAATVRESVATSKVLHDIARNQQLGVAAAQSLMMECSRTQFSHPLCSRIRLKRNWSERRATLLAIRDDELQNAYKCVMARCPPTTTASDTESIEKYETDDGDICFTGTTLVHFRGVQSLQQVFEALCFYLTNMEISISERLGHLTVRDDYDVIEGAAFNARITSSNDNGVNIESNTISFMQMFGEADPRFGSQPCAIVTTDCVEEDELYPYKSSSHVRKDVSGAIVLSVSRSEADGRVVVTMRRTGLIRLHCPQFELSPFQLQELEAGIADWGQVMIKTMREVIYAPHYSASTASVV